MRSVLSLLLFALCPQISYAIKNIDFPNSIYLNNENKIDIAEQPEFGNFQISDFNLSGVGTYTLIAESSDIYLKLGGSATRDVIAEPNADLIFNIQDFEVVFVNNSDFTLKNTTLNIKAQKIAADGSISSLEIIDSKANFEGNFTNGTGGDSRGNRFIVFNSQIDIKGKVTNYGVFRNGSETCKYDTVAWVKDCKDKPANITITGDFDNIVGQMDVSNSSTVTIQGSLTSSSFTTLNNAEISVKNALLHIKKAVYNKERSIISLYGKGVLRAEQGFYNQKGATLVFYLTRKSNNDNWDMETGRLEGDLFNEGKIIISPYSGPFIFNVGDKFQFILGKMTGLTEISFNRYQAWAIGATCHNGVLTIVDGKTLSGTTLTIPCTYDEDYTPQPLQPEPIVSPSTPSQIVMKSNHQILQKVLESKLVSINDSDIVQAVFDTETMLKTSVITQPTNMLKAFKADTLNAPLNSAYVARLTASSASIMSDASSFANPLEKASQTQFFATPFGGVLKGDDLSGHLLGLSVGLTHIDDDYIAQGHFAYANGTSTQDLQTQSTQINGNLFQVGGFGRLFYDKLETDINANFIFAKFSLDNTWLDNALNSSSNFNNYQINLGAVAGWRFGDDLSVKPFAGLQTYYENQGEFKQDMLNLTSEAYSALVMDALVGVEGRYIFENGGFAFAKASYENKLYNSHKEVFMRVGTEALRYENESYDNVASLNLGARVLATKALKLNIEGLYKHYDNGLDYLGANLSVRLSF